ncbi:MAG TPA: TetR/AcrR family transcriptional regulator [Ktedonobacteraceae bacterium]|nr:TetR/AcrR family transcriptional regulator [Ktedonobacteraceae bacterium]
MRDQVDLRVRRTQANLREALIDLIEEKGFDAVTVGDIAERAMVNRTTFYRHYPDKYALVTGIFEDAVNQMFREIGPLPKNLEGLLSSESKLDARAVQSYIESQLAAWSAFFEHVARHARLYRVMLGKRGSSWFTVQMRDYFAQAIRSRARTLSAAGLRVADDPQAAPAEFVIISLAHWLVGMLAWWIENGMASSPQQMTLWTARFALYGYPAVLGLNIPHIIGGVAPSDWLSKQS